MILKALYDYYQKHSHLPRPGFENVEFKYMIVIRADGSFDRLECLITDPKKKTGQFFFVPQSQGRSGTNSWQTAFLLWDHYGYVLGYAKPDKEPAKAEKNIRQAALQHKRFVTQIQELPDDLRRTKEIHAVLEFYRRGEEQKVFGSPEWENCAKVLGCNLSFRLTDQIEPVFSLPAVRNYIASMVQSESSGDACSGRCLVTGERAELSRLMSATPVPGGKSNAALVSFQTNSGYDSYGKTQCFNAPLSREAEFACTTALNALLGKESKNKFSLGDTTAVFWVESRIESFDLESLLPLLAHAAKENNAENIAAMRKLCEAVHSGRLPAEDRGVRYYFLGLAPNAARISIRFWKTGTVGELATNIAAHFRDLEIVSGPVYPALASLLTAVVHEYKMENVPPNLSGRMFDAIFNGTLYPGIWQNLCLQRVHVDGKVTPLRASILKAVVNRKERLSHTTSTNKEIVMNYDPTNPSEAYQCGALFALLVKAQEEANPDLNATISDRYFASASTRPATVFGTLLKLNRSHLKKLNPGRSVQFEKVIGELSEKIGPQFPTYLTPDDQGRFCLGYYQKRQELFTAKKETTNKGE